MKRIRIVGLCLVAMFALSAVAAASASAEEPEYMTCVKMKGGNYEKGCGEKVLAGSGKAELEPVASKTKFTSKSKAATFTIGTHKVTCKKDTDEGEFTTPGYDKEKITFSGCILDGNKKNPCESEGAPSGTIVTKELISQLVLLDEAETKVGVVLVGEHLGEWAKFGCGSEEFSLVGAVLGSIENNKKGEKITFAGGTIDWLEGTEEEIGLFAGAEGVTFTTVDEQGPKGVGAYL